MYSIERYAMVAARILVALIFMMTALNIISSTLAAHAMAANGIPASLIPAMNHRSTGSATRRGFRPDPRNLPPASLLLLCLCS